ncbi:hypothetical protein SRABI118_03878 [Massilia sp. Bi118]|nr:hypothetical protein SRABI118_03878 [Massilia sp. Bi118]
MPAAPHLVHDGRRNLLANLRQVEAPALRAGLIDRHLLEAVHQLGRRMQATLDQRAGFARRPDPPLKVRLFQVGRSETRRQLLGLFLQGAGHQQAVADRRIQFVGDAGHQRAERGQALVGRELGLGVLQLAVGVGVVQRHADVGGQGAKHVQLQVLVGMVLAALHAQHAQRAGAEQHRHQDQRGRRARACFVLQVADPA